MQNFLDAFETRKRSFISAFSICMTTPLNLWFNTKLQKVNSENSIILQTKLFFFYTIVIIRYFRWKISKIQLCKRPISLINSFFRSPFEMSENFIKSKNLLCTKYLKKAQESKCRSSHFFTFFWKHPRRYVRKNGSS